MKFFKTFNKQFNKILGFVLVTTLLLGLFGGIKGFAEVNVQSFVGKTYWVKQSKFWIMDDNQNFKTKVIDLKTKEYTPLNYDGYYIKLKIEKYFHADLDPITGYDADYFQITINGKGYLTYTEIITDCNVLDYEIFTKDPKTIFKYTTKQWDKFYESDFIGMTKDMIIMSYGRPQVINRTNLQIKGKKVVDEQWVYRNDYSKDKYYYFRNGILYSWQD